MKKKIATTTTTMLMLTGGVIELERRRIEITGVIRL